MNINKGTSPFLDTVLVIGIVVIFGVVGAFSSIEKDALMLDDVKVEISSSNECGLITSENVKQWLMKGHPIRYRQADVKQMEEMLLTNPYIDSVQVYKDIYKTLHVSINQRKPLMRIIVDGDSSFYICDKAAFMPLSSQYVADVIPLTMGSSFFRVFTEENSDLEKNMKKINKNDNNLKNLVNFVKEVENSDFWSSQIVQININDKNEVEFIPRIGSQLVILCDVDDLCDYKKILDKLEAFYKKELRNNINKYRIINIKYKDLIVCTK